MSDATKRYTEQEFSLILAKAAELGGTSSSIARTEDGLTIEQIKSIAAEVGLNPDLVARAARLVPGESRPSIMQRIAGGSIRAQRDLSVAGEFTEERAQRLLAAVRKTMKTHGDGSANASAMSWSNRRGNIFVSGHGEGSETRVQIAVNNRGALILPLMAGGYGIAMAFFAAVAAGDSAGGLNPYVVLVGGAGITAGFVWALLRRISGKTRATLENLIEAIGDAMDRGPHQGR